METKRIALSGLGAGFASFIVGNALYMNPWVADLYAKYSPLGCPKSMELFGGTGNWLALMMIGGLVSAVLLALLYSYTERGINMKPLWKKGALFGALFWLVSTLPASYDTWLLHSYPDILIIVETINGLAGSLVAGIVIAVLYGRIK